MFVFASAQLYLKYGRVLQATERGIVEESARRELLKSRGELDEEDDEEDSEEERYLKVRRTRACTHYVKLIALGLTATRWRSILPAAPRADYLLRVRPQSCGADVGSAETANRRRECV